MLRKDKILLISDDKDNKFFNKIHNSIKEDESLMLIYSRSDSDSFKLNIKRDYYIIYIDYDHINRNVRDLINEIIHYLLSLPLIVIGYSQKKIDEDIKCAYSFNYNSITKELYHKQLTNTIKILKYCRNVKTISFLPGNYVINEVIEKKLNNNQDFTIMYMDIDKFKAYTDYYGFFKSDAVLRFMSNIIKNNVSKYGSAKDFMGHPGGDDFVIICEDKEIAKKVGNKIVEEFDAGISDYYSEEDKKNGYISTLSRDGEIKKFPICTLSIISITNESNKYSTAEELFKEMMHKKNEAKDFSGSIMLQS